MEPDKIYKTEQMELWINQNEILFVRYYPIDHLNLETAKESVNFVLQLLEGEKLPCIFNTTEIKTISHEAFNYYKEQLPYLHPCLSLLTLSMANKILISFILKFMKPHPIPMKAFNNEPDAIEWIRTTVQKQNDNE
ncbi:MAG: hypothetical protein JEZ03_16105 [Bacteroidales bacterium]|nr:hypothetical protein [Bacteroidales bacterium]